MGRMGMRELEGRSFVYVDIRNKRAKKKKKSSMLVLLVKWWRRVTDCESLFLPLAFFISFFISGEGGQGGMGAGIIPVAKGKSHEPERL